VGSEILPELEIGSRACRTKIGFTMFSVIQNNPALSPFAPANHQAYAQWREQKLRHYPSAAEALRVDISNPLGLLPAEHAQILTNIRKTNLALYRITDPVSADKQAIRDLGRQFGLEHLDSNICADEDSITSLRVVESGRHKGYIPYSNRRLSWHTDGYYNPLDKQIRAIVMHCVIPAQDGGINMYLDHEILYLYLRDRDPAYISALMRPDVMTIPPNVEDGDEVGGEQRGPVCSIDTTGNLHMRYSARTRNIRWRDDAVTAKAVEYMSELLNSDMPYLLRYHLQANEGVICNNVLHNRTAFTDSDDPAKKRLLYRARYFDRVQGADVTL